MSVTAIIDIHTHHQDVAPDAITSFNPWEFAAKPGCLHSVGVHPWDIARATMSDYEKLYELACRADVALIGECGIDKLRGGELSLQVEVVKKHVVLSETLHKPLLLHCVRASNELCALKKSMRPLQPWIIHGFRGNAAVARQLIEAGFFISYGEHFNPESLKVVPLERLLAETDCSAVPIAGICANIASCLGHDTACVMHSISSNISHIIQGNL